MASAPSFSLSQTVITVSEDLSAEGGAYFPVAGFATGVEAGGWNEEAQLLRFEALNLQPRTLNTEY